MHVSLTGVNHQTAPVAVREKIAIAPPRLAGALASLGERLPTGVVLSTCNRTEVYTIVDDGQPADEASLAFLEDEMDIPNMDLRKYIYSTRDQAAVEHLFRVACGLDSMVIGEFEVLGQVRQALEIAEAAGMVDLALRHVFQNAVRTGRKVRDETAISRNPMSASSIAVDLATRTVGDLGGRKLLVLGVGEAGCLVAKVARERGVSEIVVANRTRERAIDVAQQLGGQPVGLDEMLDELDTTDIIVGCSGAPHWILSTHLVEAAMRRRPERPMVIIDIAVPRDVEPSAGQLPNVSLHNIDDLTEIAARNRGQRHAEIEEVSAIIDAEVGKFASWWDTYQVRPIISALMGRAEEIRQREMKRSLKKLRALTDEEQYSVEAMTRSIVAKILDRPVKYLKANAAGGDHVGVVDRLFGLSETKRR
jgi:glutamyl-tRNA reductase